MREQERLTERHGEPFAGDGIDGTGDIADEECAVCVDARQAAVGGDGAAQPRSSGCLLQARGERRKRREGGGEIGIASGGASEQRDANFPRAYWRDVDLAGGAPVDLNGIAPGRHGEMPARGEAHAAGTRGSKTDAMRQRGAVATGKHQPVGVV